MSKPLNRTTASAPQTRPVKILQFGKGNFLRAFADWMVDIANEKSGFNGSIQIVQSNARENDVRFEEQEGLYHIVTRGLRHGKSVHEIRLITCVVGVINPFENYDAFLQTGENPDLEFIISNTTEAGIEFNSDDRDPFTPARSFPGKLTALLYRRFQHFGPAMKRRLTILPCELTEKNGETLRQIVLQYADYWKLEDAFKSWISDHVLFCNTLVDRIVPGFPKDTIDDITQTTGFSDRLTVSTEPYHLWLIAPVRNAASGPFDLRTALPLEQAGLNVRIVEDLTPYRTRKVRILNGAHTTMVPIAYLRGLRTVRDAVEDDVTGPFIRDAIEQEIIPTLDMPASDLLEFAHDVIERFRNPSIRHELASIALNSISKFQVRVLPSIIEYNKRKKQLPERLLYSLAALILFYKGEWRGKTIPLNDTPQVLAFFKEAWAKGNVSDVVRKVLSNRELWKMDLTSIDGLASKVTSFVRDISDLKFKI